MAALQGTGCHNQPGRALSLVSLSIESLRCGWLVRIESLCYGLWIRRFVVGAPRSNRTAPRCVWTRAHAGRPGARCFEGGESITFWIEFYHESNYYCSATTFFLRHKLLSRYEQHHVRHQQSHRPATLPGLPTECKENFLHIIDKYLCTIRIV